MLSGKELIELSERIQTKLLPVGTKLVTLEEATDKNEELGLVKKNYKEVCSKERISRLESRMTGKYNPLNRTVTIQKLTGTSHRLFGQADKSGIHLKLYEALYLLEIDDLIVYYDDVIVSIEQAYALFLDGNENLEWYSAYKTLLQSGFVVLKHQNIHSVEESTESSPEIKPQTSSMTTNHQIWDYLRSQVHFLNWDNIKCSTIDDVIPVQFRQSCYSIQDGASNKSTGPQIKKQKFETHSLPQKTDPQDNFLDSNEKYGYENIFKSLDVIGLSNVEVSLKEPLFDFDIYYAEDAKRRKLSQNNLCTPNFYGKVVNFNSPIDYSLINALKSRVCPTPVMLIIVYDNLNISTFIC